MGQKFSICYLAKVELSNGSAISLVEFRKLSCLQESSNSCLHPILKMNLLINKKLI